MVKAWRHRAQSVPSQIGTVDRINGSGISHIGAVVVENNFKLYHSINIAFKVMGRPLVWRRKNQRATACTVSGLMANSVVVAINGETT